MSLSFAAPAGAVAGERERRDALRRRQLEARQVADVAPEEVAAELGAVGPRREDEEPVVGRVAEAPRRVAEGPDELALAPGRRHLVEVRAARRDDDEVLRRAAVVGPVCKSTTGLGRRGQTSEISSSVKSKSIRLIFGQIDCSHRVLEAQWKCSCQNVRLRAN